MEKKQFLVPNTPYLMMKTFSLFLFMGLFFMSCVPEGEVKKREATAYYKGVKEEKARSAKKIKTAEKKAYALAIAENKQRWITEGRKETFIETSILGIKKIYPDSVIFGVYIFIILSVSSILWTLFYLRINNYIITQIRAFRWSVFARMGHERKLKIKKERWNQKSKNIEVKSAQAQNEIRRYQEQVSVYNGFMKAGIPEEQKEFAHNTITVLNSKISFLEKVISNGDVLRSHIENMKRGIDMGIYRIKNGEQINAEDLHMDFVGVQEDIKMYLKFDVQDISGDLPDEFIDISEDL